MQRTILNRIKKFTELRTLVVPLFYYSQKVLDTLASLLIAIPYIKQLTIWSDPLTLIEPNLSKPFDRSQIKAKENLFFEPFICYGKLVKAIRRCLVLVRLSFSCTEIIEWSSKHMEGSQVSPNKILETLVFILEILGEFQTKRQL